MYDMSGFDYDIRDVVRVLGLRIRRKNALSYDLDCPFCGNRKGKLNVNIQKNVFRCNYCGEQGGMLDLYARLHGVSKSEANRQLREALRLGRRRGDYPERDYKQDLHLIENSVLAPEAEIDHTYSRLLDALILSDKHREDLLHRGLTESQIEMQRYRSVPVFGVKPIVKALAEDGCTLEGVPGFYPDQDGSWTVHFTAKNSGILIPILSPAGMIQGFQIRLDHATDSRKYIWLSSVNYHKGTSSGSPVHFIGDPHAETVYVTEGALKGNIAHCLSGRTFVCAAGVNQYRNLKPMLRLLQQQGTRCVVEAYDMDKLMKTRCDHQGKRCRSCILEPAAGECPRKVEKRRLIQNGCRKVYEICHELGLSVERNVWDMDPSGQWNGRVKGIDDLYYGMAHGLL